MAEFSASEGEGDVYEVEKVLDSRKTGRTTEYLVKWRNFDEGHNSWEPQRNLSGAKEALAEFLGSQGTPAKPQGTPGRSVKKVITSSKILGDRTGGSTVTKTITTTTTKADLSSPESSPVLRRRTVETTRFVTASGATKKPSKKGRNIFGRFFGTLAKIPVPIMIQIVCLLVFFGTFIPFKSLK